MDLYPLFADLKERRVLVVGGGAVATRKIEMLLRAGACVEVVAARLCGRLLALRRGGSIRHRALLFAPPQLDGVWLVVAATDDAKLNQRVAAVAAARQVFANVVDDVALSSFQVPAVVDRSPLVVAVSSGGAAPMLARAVRERIEVLLAPSLGPLARLLERARARIRAALPSTGRRQWYERLLAGSLPALVAAGREDAAATELERALVQPQATPVGRVTLVGAGPGAAGLLTLDALRALQQADVILHDALVLPEVLDLARRDAERIDVGKRAGGVGTSQARIHELLLEHARAGRAVVRLKGGDPCVFGRGGEEMQALRAAGIAYTLVPGVTAALACAAYAGIPLTHRGHAQSLRLLTAHCADSIDSLDWRALAAERQTLAVYMGSQCSQRLRDRLLAHGRPADTPVALIENGTCTNQRVLRGSLDELPALAHALTPGAPALLVIGEVAMLTDALHWFGDPPSRLPAAGLARAA
ncbi:MAG: uroporphyrinogen-III C-methyltransferase [Xanthomonadales bacterium]|nr:Siroheme synthase [Xanthomonadales bacterium]MCC6592141.1 uroporphyrinogen-III C-methyltransferase [Xanthomonadales bacterium]MCE7931138.1 uroporphyrinogen-III C-methyltransferase [Xanthomonadales bacterium PRO6]